MSSRFAAASSSSKSSATSAKRKSSLIDILTISDDDPMGKASELDPAKRAELNKALGFADPPVQVFALGKDESAAVWWSVAADDTITSWEIHRYRKDRSRPNGEWLYKGFIATSAAMVKNQVIVNHLTNDYEYRFTVKSGNVKGMSLESTPSNPVMVEAPLPPGWHRFHDPPSSKYYYANMRSGKSTWTRPELDPWFLDDSILLAFEPREMTALKALFVEDMMHFGEITVEQFMDVLREIGEHCSKSWVTRLIKGFTGGKSSLSEWKHFMEVVHHIKRSRVEGDKLLTNPWEKLVLFFSRSRIKALLRPKREKLGDWVVEHSSLADRDYYRNVVTGESHWSMPSQVRFYVPPKLENKLLQVFDYGDIEEFQQYFALLDVDSSGDLSKSEIKLLLKSLDIEISESKLSLLLNSIDLNGNGTVEFDEFCWMMHQLYRSDKNESSFWAELRLSKKIDAFADADADGARDSPVEGPPSQSTKSAAMRYSFGASSEDMNNLSFEHVTGTLNALRMLSSRSRTATGGGATPNSSVKSQRMISNKAVKMKTSMFNCSCMSASAVVPDPYQSGKGGGMSQLNAALSHIDEDELSLSSSLDNPTGAANQRRRRRSLLIAETSMKSATTQSFANDDGDDDVSAYGDDDDDDATSGVFGSTNKSTKGSTKSRRSQRSKGSSKKHHRATLSSSDDVSMFGNEEELDELFGDEQEGISGKTHSQDDGGGGHGKYCLCGCRSY